MIECLGCSRIIFWNLGVDLDPKKTWMSTWMEPFDVDPKNQRYFFIFNTLFGVFFFQNMLAWIFAIFCVYYNYVSKIRAHCLKELNIPNWFQGFTGFSGIFETSPFWFRMEDIALGCGPRSNSEKWRFIGIPKACCIQLLYIISITSGGTSHAIPNGFT